jgi:hypothetical protein
MKLKNNFTEESIRLFSNNQTCWFCGENHANCFHHILGRVSKSPLNIAPLNNFQCHISNGLINTDKWKKILLQKTLKYLLSNNYRLTEEDLMFIKKFKYYYEI